MSEGKMHGYGKQTLLSPQEEVALARKMRQGDHAAFHQLVQANIGWVVTLARQYARREQDIGDLAHEGIIGLIKSVRRYDPERINPETNQPYRMTTYVTRPVCTAIARYQKYRIQKFPDLRLENGLSHGDVDLSDRFTSQDADPAEACGHDEFLPLLKKALRHIDARERKVITRRYGLGTKEETQPRIGASLGVSAERVRQIEVAALEHLGYWMGKLLRTPSSCAPANA